MSRLQMTLLGVALASALAPAVASASPQDLFGYGGRSPALAMTGTSYAEGFESVFVNPAGLGPVRSRALGVGFMGGGFDLRIDGERSRLTPPRGIVIGFHLPLPFGDVLEDRLTFGGAFYTPAESLLRGTVRFPEVPQWAVLDRAQAVGIMLGLGIDLHGVLDGLHVGIGVSALATVLGTLDVRLDETNAFSSVVEVQLLASYAPNVGLTYRAEQWGLGLSYRHELVSEIDLDVRTADLPVDLPVLRIGGIAHYDPASIQAEGYWRPEPDLLLALNVTTRLWNFYPGSQIPTTAMGRNAPDPEFSAVPSPRLAVEKTLREGMFELAIRGGYAFEPSPAASARNAPRRTNRGDDVPSDVVPYRLLDNHRHVITVGLGWTVHVGGTPGAGERIVVDAFGQLHVLQARTHDIPASDASATRMVTDGVVLVGGWTARVEF